MTPPALPCLLLLLACAGGIAAAVPADPVAWDAAGDEGRWRILRGDLGRRPEALAEWVAALAARGDHRQLEWLALSYEFRAPAETLLAGSAPAWLRTAWWMRSAADSHSADLAGEQLALPGDAPAAAVVIEARRARDRREAVALIARRAALTHGWLVAYADRIPDAARWIESYRTANVPPAAPAGLLPPWREAELFAALAPLEPLSELAEGRPAEPGRLYVHQVERALDCFVRAGRYDQPWLGLVSALTGHAHPGARRAAWLALASLPPHLVAVEPIDAAIADAAQPTGVRQAALLALAANRAPGVDLRLLDLAAEPGPLRALAVSRLADLGDAYVLERLVRLAGDDPGLAPMLARLRARLAQPQAFDVDALLMRAAWADLGCRDDQHELVAWTTTAIARVRDQPAVRKRLAALAEPPQAGASEDALPARMRLYAARLLAGQTPQATTGAPSPLPQPGVPPAAAPGSPPPSR